jgi:hypothetical protein
MRCSIVHAPNPIPILILCGYILPTQAQAASLVLSPDQPELTVEHICFATEDGGLIYWKGTPQR